MCPLRLVGRWVPLDFLLLYTCPLQLLDYFGGVRRGSGRRGRAARRLPEAGLALLSPPSPPRLNRVASSARRCRIISLSLYSCLHLLILTYTILYNNTGQTIVLPLCERVDALFIRVMSECVHRLAPPLSQLPGSDHLHTVLCCTPSSSPSSDADVPFTGKISVSFF